MIVVKLVMACAVAMPIAIISGVTGASLLACVATYYIAATMIFLIFVALGLWQPARRKTPKKHQSERSALTDATARHAICQAPHTRFRDVAPR